MTLNFIVVVNDDGELKTVGADELTGAIHSLFEKEHGVTLLDVEGLVGDALNAILDERAIAAGEYDPSDNDTPMVFSVDDDFAHDDEIEERHRELRSMTGGQ